MEGESYWVFERMRLQRLLQAHPDWSNRQYAREMQHDAKWVRKWRQRMAAGRPESLEVYRSRSRAPHHVPKRVSAESKELVMELRQSLSEQFHRRAGPKTLWFGYRHRQAQGEQRELPHSARTLTRILHERGAIQIPPPAPHEYLTLPPPLEEWELDFGEIRLAGGERYEFLLVVDRGTSRVVYVEGGIEYRADTALAALQRLFVQQGLPKRLRFDRDPRLWGSWTRDSYPSPWGRVLRAVGVTPVVCPPRRPDLKPFVERCIGTLKHEWLARAAPTTLAEANDALSGFSTYYNTQRPHQGRACRNRTPQEAFPVLPTPPPLPDQVVPDAWLRHEHKRVYRRRVAASGTVHIDQHRYFLGRHLAHQLVFAQLDADHRCFMFSDGQQIVKRIPIAGLYGEALMDIHHYIQLAQAESRLIESHHRALWEQQAQAS